MATRPFSSTASPTLRAWLADPNRIKPGSHMPAMKLTDQQLDELLQYLLTLH